MKKRKFASGGFFASSLPGPGPMNPGYLDNGNGSARSGLDQINQGSSTVSGALDRVGGSLKQASEAIGDGGGGVGPSNPRPSPFPGFGSSGGDEFDGPYPTSPVENSPGMTMKKGGKVKGYAKGGSVSSASRRGDGIAQRGKTKGRMV